MRVYFLAEQPAAHFVGGAYFGRADSFARSAEVALTDGLLLSFVPSGDFLPLQFTLGEDTLFSPPRGISLYRAENLLAVRAHGFLHADPALRAALRQAPDVIMLGEMRVFSRKLTDAEIEQLANWYAAQPGRVGQAPGTVAL